jgi:hypothetical protein
MSYTLWRNDRLLGALVREFKSDSPDYTVGFLACTADFTDVSVLHQHWVPEWPWGPIVQHRFPLPEQPEPAASDDAAVPSCDPLAPRSGDLGVVPPEAVLEIRDAAGETVLTQAIMVDRVVGCDDAVVTAYAARGDMPSSWSLAFVRRGAGSAKFSAQESF